MEHPSPIEYVMRPSEFELGVVSFETTAEVAPYLRVVEP